MAPRMEARQSRRSGLSGSAGEPPANHTNRVMPAHPVGVDDSNSDVQPSKTDVMLVTDLGTLVLAGFVGYAVISKVPNGAAITAERRGG
jgi:hypothetical protein